MDVPPQLLQRYLTGDEAVPDSLVLSAIDIVLEALPERRPAPGVAVLPVSAAGD